MDIRYPVLLEGQKEGGFFVRFLDFEDVFTEGETEEEALFNAIEVLSAMLAAKIEDGDAIPVPSKNIPGAMLVSPDAKTQAALLVRFARGKQSMAELARALQTSWPSAKRLEDPTHWPTLKGLERAASVLGKRLIIHFE